MRSPPRCTGQNVRVFARSTISHPALARTASESARSLPQAAVDHASELCLSPVGLALVTRIAPATMAAMLMGVWFLSSFAANLLLGYLAGMLESEERGAVFHFLEGQADFFMILVVISLAAGTVLLPGSRGGRAI